MLSRVMSLRYFWFRNHWVAPGRFGCPSVGNVPRIRLSGSFPKVRTLHFLFLVMSEISVAVSLWPRRSSLCRSILNSAVFVGGVSVALAVKVRIGFEVRRPNSKGGNIQSR